MLNKNYYIYILASDRNTMLYIGVTNDLLRRVLEHKEKLNSGFTSEYNIHKLVYYEHTGDISVAIGREKQLKKWNRAWKNDLVEKFNPDWNDLFPDLLENS